MLLFRDAAADEPPVILLLRVGRMMDIHPHESRSLRICTISRLAVAAANAQQIVAFTYQYTLVKRCRRAWLICSFHCGLEHLQGLLLRLVCNAARILQATEGARIQPFKEMHPLPCCSSVPASSRGMTPPMLAFRKDEATVVVQQIPVRVAAALESRLSNHV